MVFPDESIPPSMMSEFHLHNVFLSPGIRLSDANTQGAGAPTSAVPSNHMNVGAQSEGVEMKDGEQQDGSLTPTVPVRASSSPEDADGSVTTKTARSKESVGGSEETATSRTSQSPDNADTSDATPTAEYNGSVVGSRQPVVGSQECNTVPAALDGTAEPRGSTSANISTAKRQASIHDLSAASYLARHITKTAQNHVTVPASRQPVATAPVASSSKPTLPPQSQPPPAPAERSQTQTQTITYENRAVQYQTIENKFQALWTRRENEINSFSKTYKVTLSVDQSTVVEDDNNNNDNDEKRKDSFAIASEPTTSTSTRTLPQLLTAARHRALESLLEAWFVRLGTPSPPPDSSWTRYSEKTTPLACLTLRQILTSGDTSLRIPIAALPAARRAFWAAKLRSVKWWFISVNTAVDFLSAFGVGETNRFGCGIARVEVLQYSRDDGNGNKCLSPEHVASEAAWRAGVGDYTMRPNAFPPVRYCPCSEYKLLMKILGGAQKLPEPGGEACIRWLGERLKRDWQAANLAGGVDVAREWPGEVGRGNLPVVLSFGGFAVWHCLRRDGGRGVACRVFRIEGRFAELL